MITAVMQPYLFPYIGYYQLVYISDYFVMYDDVSYIKRGYINRNNILLDGDAKRFTLPVKNASQNSKIQDLYYLKNNKILKMIEFEYKKKPYFDQVFPMIEFILNHNDRRISNINALSIEKVFDYLGIGKKIIFASEFSYNRELSRADRLIEITRVNKCDCYINSSGGRSLYNKNYFLNQGIELKFLDMKIHEYSQGQKNFIPYLSIIDILMNCSKQEIKEILEEYELS